MADSNITHDKSQGKSKKPIIFIAVIAVIAVIGIIVALLLNKDKEEDTPTAQISESSTTTQTTEAITTTEAEEEVTTKEVIPPTWSSFIMEDDYDIEASFDIADDGIAITVENATVEDYKTYYYYYVQGKYSVLSLEKDAVYKIEFDYESSTDIDVEFIVQRDYDDYGGYYYEMIPFSNVSQHYSKEFTMPVDDDRTGIVFNSFDSYEPCPYNLKVSNFSIVKVE